MDKHIDELEKIYEEMKKEAEKDSKKEFNIKDFDNIIVEDDIIDTQFFEDNCVNDLINFINTYNRTSLINSLQFQKNKALHCFIDFISFKKILHRFYKDYNSKVDFKKFNSYHIIYEEQDEKINNILNISEDLSEEKSLKEFTKPKSNDNSKSKILNKSTESSKNKTHKQDSRNKNISNKSTKEEKIKNNSGIGKSSLTLDDDKKTKTIDIETKEKNLNITDKINKKNKEKTTNFGNTENSDGLAYERNATDFIKYALFFSFLEKEVEFPEKINLQFDERFLQMVGIEKSKKMKENIQFDLVVKSLFKNDLESLIENLKSNIFLKEKMNLKNYSKDTRFDLLIEVARNYFMQSQDKYNQINTYLTLIKIINYFKKLKNNGEISKEQTIQYNTIVTKLKINPEHEQIFILITNGSYHLLSQIISLYNEKKFTEIKKEKVDLNKLEYSFDYKDETDRKLYNFIKEKPINKVLSASKNRRNIPNLKKFLQILYDLEESNIPYSIIYFEDDLRNSFDNNILNKFCFRLKYEDNFLVNTKNNNYKKVAQEIEKIDKINQANLLFKTKTNNFINILTKAEVKVKRLIDEYYIKLKNNNNLSTFIENTMDKYLKFPNVDYFVRNKAKIYLDVNEPSTLIIIKKLKNLFNCKFILTDFGAIDYQNYLSKLYTNLIKWLLDINMDLFSIDYTNNINYKDNGFFSSDNILEVIEYNLKKYLKIEPFFDRKMDLKDLMYDESVIADKTFYEEFKNILEPIVDESKKLFLPSINLINPKDILMQIINNCKCHYFYSLLFSKINYYFDLNRSDINLKLFNIFKKN